MNEIYVIINSCSGDAECAQPGTVGGWFETKEAAMDFARRDAEAWYDSHHEPGNAYDDSVTCEYGSEYHCVVDGINHCWEVVCLAKAP